MKEIVFHTTDKGNRWRVTVQIDDESIARVLGAKAVRNRTHRSHIKGFARAKATLVASDQPTTE